MAALTINVPDEAAELLGPERALEADSVELADLIAWNLRVQADRLAEWAESADHPTEVAREVGEAIAALTAAFVAVEEASF